MRRLLRIRDREGRTVGLELNRAQRAFGKNYRRRNIVLKARQMGITTYTAARFFLKTITIPGTLSVQVAHDQSSAEEIFKIVHRFLENLPEGLRAGALRTSRANVRQIVFPRLDSEYRVETAADANAGRGLTIQNLHCSEVARWPRFAKETMASLQAAVPPGGEMVLESTPKGAWGQFYEEWQRAEETGTVKHFFPWWLEENYRIAGGEAAPLTEEELLLVKEHGLDAEQIAFRRGKISSFREYSRQEYAEDAESCFRASGECVFDIEKLEERMAQCGEPMETRDNGRLEIWFPPQKGKRYIIGADPAGGGALGDYACAEVIESKTGLQCAEMRGHWTPQEFAIKVMALGAEYNMALLAVERNNHGHAVLAHLGHAGYGNIFAHRGQAGWLTTSTSKHRLVAELSAAMNACPEQFNSRRLLGECRSFETKANATAGAAAGANDDCVMAMGIALLVRAEGEAVTESQCGRRAGGNVPGWAIPRA